MLSTKSYLTFQLSDEMFLTGVEKINSILTYQDVTPVPDSPKYLTGLINWRGEVLPIFDLRTLLGLQATPLNNRTLFLVTEISKDGDIVKVAFVIDYAMDVLEVDASAIQKMPDVNQKVDTEYIDGIYYKDKSSFLLINLEELVLQELKKDISAVSKVIA